MKRQLPIIDVGQQLLSFARDERPAPPPAPRFAEGRAVVKKDLRSDIIWNSQLAKFDGIAKVRRAGRKLGPKSKQPGNFISRNTVVSTAMPNALVDRIDEERASTNESRSDLVRRILTGALGVKP
jgi:ribbon-helix-helix CopG family protein